MRHSVKKLKRKQKELKRHKINKLKQNKCSVCKARLKGKTQLISYSKRKFYNKKKEDKRIVILLGAGAATIWNGASSSVLKKLIENDTKYNIKGGTKTIGKYIFEKLAEYYNNNANVNFETFLAVLETIVDYYYEVSIPNKNPSFHSIYPSLFNFYTESDSGSISIEKLKGDSSPQDLDKYFFKIWNHYFKLIVNKIDEYAFNVIDEPYKEINESFRRLIRYYKNRKNIVRIYTTNYDNAIPDIFKGYQKVFNGFKPRRDVSFSNLYEIDSDKIFNDRNCLNYYNLHGSLYWKRIHKNSSYSFDNTDHIPNNVIEPVSAASDNPGHQHIPTNIIAGYLKLQRVSIEPFNLFFNSFFNDCKEADEILTIGYSFGDYHINNILTQKFTTRNRKNFHISYEKGEPAGQNKQAIFQNMSEFQNFQRICGNTNFYPLGQEWLLNNNAKIFLGGFEKFLGNEFWESL